MRLYHFSENPKIDIFVPRPVRKSVVRPEGQEWLNGPLVWAIGEACSFLYLFPRDCPRILIWATSKTSAIDRTRWLGDTRLDVLGYIEETWLERLSNASIHRYELPKDSFEDLGEIDMWVSKTAVKPIEVEELSNLPRHLKGNGVDLRVVKRLTPFKNVWDSTVHASGIRLRNAIGWGNPS